MTVLLRQQKDLLELDHFEYWFTVGVIANAPAALKAKPMLPLLAEKLEAAFDLIRPVWWDIAKELGQAEPTARWAHVPTAGSYGSDFGLMLAWSYVVRDAAKDSPKTLVICDDPWMFRFLSQIPGVLSGSAPSFLYRVLHLRVRGFVAQCAVAFRMFRYAIGLRNVSMANLRKGASAALVYGHPRSNSEGFDAYFGDQLQKNPDAQRVLHTDCHMGRAKMLAQDGRTVSLHAWGNPFFAFCLPLSQWRPTKTSLQGEYGLLIDRSRVMENASGARAINRWQEHCQRRWLINARPACVVWPWENHGWERILVRDARKLGVETIGYQHTVVGRHQFNFSVKSNADGTKSIPDRIICNGPAYRAQLEALGLPKDRLEIGGAIRIARPKTQSYNKDAPIYVALSGINFIAQQMIDAIVPLANKGMRFIVKDHPMHPHDFKETANIQRVATTIPETKDILAVIYTTGTTGLEGLFAGVPTYRILLKDTISLDIMPDDVRTISVTAENLGETLQKDQSPTYVSWDSIMTEVDDNVWHKILTRP